MPLHPLRRLLITLFVASTGLIPHVSFATAQPPAAPAKLSPEKQEIAGIHERIRRCAAIQEISIRIGCYDDYAIELGYITPERAKADIKKLNNIGLWQITQADNGYGLVQTQLRLESLNKLPTGKGFDRHVNLIIRCVPGKTEAMLDWKMRVVGFLMSKGTSPKALVNYKTDSSKTIAEEWDASTDQLALFAPDAITFARQLMNKKTLTMSLNATSDSATARFDVEGIEKALDEIVKACYSTPK